MTTLKKIFNITIDVLIGIAFIIALIITISSINQKKNGVASIFGYISQTVQSDSMEDTIKVGDLIISKQLTKEEMKNLKVGDIISFYFYENKVRRINTHRIVEIKYENAETFYITQGDNKERCPSADAELKSRADIVGLYQGVRIGKIGSAIDFLKTELGFYLCIVAPIVIFILVQIYRLIVIIVHNKKVQMLEEVKEQTPEEVKEAIIQEYLNKMNKQENNDKKDENEIENKDKDE